MKKSLCFSCGHILENKVKDYECQKEDGTFKAFFPNLEIFYCGKCGIGQVDHEKIDRKKLDYYYQKVYRSISIFNEFNQEEGYRKAYFTARAKGQINLMKKYLAQIDVKNILEFGSGSGVCLTEMAKQFPEAKLYATEIDETVPLPVNVFKDGKEVMYDIILMSHVLEHLVCPQEIVRDLISQMNSNGLLIIEVPNQKVDKKSPSFEPHITFFSMKSIEQFFLTHFSMELTVLQVTTSGSVQMSKQKKDLKYFIKNNAYFLFVILRWCYRLPGRLFTRQGKMREKPSVSYEQLFNFSNDSTEDIYNDIRIVLRKI